MYAAEVKDTRGEETYLLPRGPFSNLHLLPMCLAMNEPPFDLGLRIPGHLTIFKEPQVFLYFSDHPNKDQFFNGVIDTGTTYSLVQEGFVDQFSSKPEIIRYSQYRDIQTGKEMKTPIFNLKFQFVGKEPIITHEFGVHQNLRPNKFLLGTLFLCRCESFKYYGKKEEFVLEL